MKYITLNNGLKMQMVGLGTWDLRGEKGKQSIINALKTGYRLIDTEQMYGNEDIVGQAIIESKIPREEIFITTKLNRSCAGYHEAKKGILRSLKNLQTNYIDLLLIHEPYPEALEMYKAMEEAYLLKKVRAIGISNFHNDNYENFISTCNIKPAVNQIESHVYYPQLSFKQKMDNDDIQMESWACFTEGRKDIFKEPILIKIGRKYHKSAAQVALAYLIQNGIIVIPKTSHLERMIENINIFDFNLSDEDMAQIKLLNLNHSLFNWYD